MLLLKLKDKSKEEERYPMLEFDIVEFG